MQFTVFGVKEFINQLWLDFKSGSYQWREDRITENLTRLSLIMNTW